MANYAASVLVNGQALVTARNQMPEQRRQMPSIMELALKNQQYSIPNAQELRTSPLRPVDIMYFLKVAPGSATTKSYNHTGTKGDSGKINATYSQIVETFSMPRKEGYNNYLTYDQMFANRYEEAWRNIRTRQDNAALAFLYTFRNQLDATTMNARLASAGLTWDGANFAVPIASSDKSLFIAKAKAAMAANYYVGQYDIVTDLQLGIQFENYINQGTGNFSNTQWQFADCNFTRTQNVIDANFQNGSTLVMPQGMFAGLVWNEGLNKKGLSQDIGGPVGTFGTIPDPFGSGAIADVSMYTQRADTSADTYGGSTQDVVDQWELTLNIGYVLPPIALTNDSVVIEVAQS